MERIATFMVLIPGTEERYRQEHSNIWTEVKTGISRFGFHNDSIFIHGQQLSSDFEVDNLEQTTNRAVEDPDNQRWQADMAGLFELVPDIREGASLSLE